MELSAKVRKETGKGPSRKMRVEVKNKSKHVINRDARVPAVVYGKGGSVPISLDEKEINKFFRSHEGGTKLIELGIESDTGIEKKQVILQEQQMVGFSRRIQHIDFREVDEDSVLEVQVPIQTVGNSVGVKMGGVIQIIRHTLPLACKVKDIPEYIEIDISELDFGQSIHILDISYPPGVKPVVYGRNFTIMTLTGSKGKASDDDELEGAEGAVGSEEE